jgi:hypothetical protein
MHLHRPIPNRVSASFSLGLVGALTLVACGGSGAPVALRGPDKRAPDLPTISGNSLVNQGIYFKLLTLQGQLSE